MTKKKKTSLMPLAPARCCCPQTTSLSSDEGRRRPFVADPVSPFRPPTSPSIYRRFSTSPRRSSLWGRVSSPDFVAASEIRCRKTARGFRRCCRCGCPCSDCREPLKVVTPDYVSALVSVCLSTFLSVFLSTCLPPSFPTFLCVCDQSDRQAGTGSLFVCLSVSQSVSQSVCLSACLSTYLFVFLSASFHVCMGSSKSRVSTKVMYKFRIPHTYTLSPSSLTLSIR